MIISESQILVYEDHDLREYYDFMPNKIGILRKEESPDSSPVESAPPSKSVSPTELIEQTDPVDEVELKVDSPVINDEIIDEITEEIKEEVDGTEEVEVGIDREKVHDEFYSRLKKRKMKQISSRPRLELSLRWPELFRYDPPAKSRDPYLLIVLEQGSFISNPLNFNSRK